MSHALNAEKTILIVETVWSDYTQNIVYEIKECDVDAFKIAIEAAKAAVEKDPNGPTFREHLDNRLDKLGIDFEILGYESVTVSF